MKQSKSELNFRDLSQADRDLVDKMVKGGSGQVTRRDALKLAMVTGVSLTDSTFGKSISSTARRTFVSRSMAFKRFTSDGSTKDHATPLAPARAVRPIR